MGYLSSDMPPRGEICVKTKVMIDGYYKNELETSEKFQDGFFCTGDIGVMDSSGHVTVIDRKKNIFKLAQGEFVAPERIESMYESLSNLIEQVYLYGNIYHHNVLAVIVPHSPSLIEWEKKQQITNIRASCNQVEHGKLIIVQSDNGKYLEKDVTGEYMQHNTGRRLG